MKGKILIHQAYVTEGDCYERDSEDGPIIVFDYFVRAETDTMVYQHHVTFAGCFMDEEGIYRVNYGAGKVADRLAFEVGRSRYIDPDCWIEVGPIETSEVVLNRLKLAWADTSDYYGG